MCNNDHYLQVEEYCTDCTESVQNYEKFYKLFDMSEKEVKICYPYVILEHYQKSKLIAACIHGCPYIKPFIFTCMPCAMKLCKYVKEVRG